MRKPKRGAVGAVAEEDAVGAEGEDPEGHPKGDTDAEDVDAAAVEEDVGAGDVDAAVVVHAGEEEWPLTEREELHA